MPQPKTVLPNGVSTPDQIFAQIDDRYAPVKLELPDYPGTVVEVQMLSAGDEEHANQYAKNPDGTRNPDAFMRIICAYALANPRFAEDKDPRVQAEKIAEMFKRFPADWLAPIFQKGWDMTYDYQRKRTEREREDAQSSHFFLKRDSERLSLVTASESSTPTS